MAGTTQQSPTYRGVPGDLFGWNFWDLFKQSAPPPQPGAPQPYYDKDGKGSFRDQGGVVYQEYEDGQWRPLPGVPAPTAKESTAAPSGAGLPAGFVQKADGLVYRQTEAGLRTATPAELDAINAPKGGAGEWHGFAPQYGQHELANGDMVFTRNGEVFNTIPAGEWRNLTPQQKFDQETKLREQADAAAMARQNASDTASGQRNAADIASANSRAANTESGINNRFGVSSQEAATMDRAHLAENARQANLQSATSAFGDVTRITPQLGQLALDNAGFTRDVLKSAPDYLARAFFQQGQTSPLPQVSQADIINHLRSNIEGFNTTLQGFNPQVGAYQAPAAFNPGAPAGFPTSAPAAVSAVAAPAIAAAPAVDYSDAAMQARISASRAAGSGSGGFGADNQPAFSGYAAGGFTADKQFMVGDSRSGAPTGFEEKVVNPTGAPIAVQPMNQPTGQPAAQQQVDPVARQRKTAHDSIAKVIGFVEKPELQHALVDEMAKFGAPQPKADSQDMPRYAAGTGFSDIVSLPGIGVTTIGSPKHLAWADTQPGGRAAQGLPGAPSPMSSGFMGFNTPQLPTPGAANQTDISALEKSVRPPAINQLLNGGTPGEMQFGFNLFTPNQIGSLSREGRDALGTTLGTQFNETVPNVEDAIKRRWSTGNRTAAGTVGF